MADYLLQEDGFKIALEDGTGFILLEDTANKARVSQNVVEAVVSPTDLKARVSQNAVEALILPDEAKARVSQFALEVIVSNRTEFVTVFIIDPEIEDGSP